MLEVTDLHVSYGGAVRALHGVSVQVADQQVVAVLGSNGAGKSTLLRTVSATLRLHRGAVVGGAITYHGQSLAGLLVFSSDVNALGLQTAQGLALTETWYWDMNDTNRAWTKRWHEAGAGAGKFPTMIHAGVYAGIMHYLKAVAALKSAADGKAVVAQMKKMPTDDPLFGKGTIRADGRKIHPAYLFEVKKPSESKGPWDYYKLIGTTPGEQAFRPLSESACPLVKK